MRASRLLVVAFVFSIPAAAEPPLSAPHGETGLGVYSDDMSTTVVTPRASAGVTLPAAIDVEAHWVADVISSASVDIVTAATTRMTDLRNDMGVALVRENLLSDLDVDAGYTLSIENDTTSHTVNAGVKRSFFDQNLDVAIRWGASYNRIGVLDQPTDQWDVLWVHNADLAGTFVLDRRTTAELVLSGFLAMGINSSPYRRVPILTGDDLRRAEWLPEAVPSTRLRGAATARLRHAFGRRLVASVEYRFYGDDWNVVSHTEALEASLDLGAGLSLRARERGTLQTGASFYHDRYDDSFGWRTRDRRLSPHESISGGLALQWSLGAFATASDVDVMLSGDALAWNYHDYLGPALSSTGQADLETLGWVTGMLAQVGVTAEW